MNNINAAIGLGNLEELQTALDARKVVSDAYEESGLPILMRPWLAVLVHPMVPQIEAALADSGIKISGYHYRNDKYTVFGGRRTDLPMMDKLEGRYTLLPFHQGMSAEDAAEVIKLVKDVLVWSWQ